jgi:RimJ/RimL family protein N-acetyltransferase
VIVPFVFALMMNVKQRLASHLRQPTFGIGYGTEAVKRLLDHLFVEYNLHRVRANCDPVNIASVKLMQRIGLRCEGHFVKSLWFKNSWVNELWFAILREEWKLI